MSFDALPDLLRDVPEALIRTEVRRIIAHEKAKRVHEAMVKAELGFLQIGTLEAFGYQFVCNTVDDSDFQRSGVYQISISCLDCPCNFVEMLFRDKYGVDSERSLFAVRTADSSDLRWSYFYCDNMRRFPDYDAMIKELIALSQEAYEPCGCPSKHYKWKCNAHVKPTDECTCKKEWRRSGWECWHTVSKVL